MREGATFISLRPPRCSWPMVGGLKGSRINDKQIHKEQERERNKPTEAKQPGAGRGIRTASVVTCVLRHAGGFRLGIRAEASAWPPWDGGRPAGQDGAVDVLLGSGARAQRPCSDGVSSRLGLLTARATPRKPRLGLRAGQWSLASPSSGGLDGISRGSNYTCPSHHLPKRNRNGGVTCRTLGAPPAPNLML